MFESFRPQDCSGNSDGLSPLEQNLLSLSEAAKRLPPRRKGRRPHVSTLFRWTNKGCRGVILKSWQIGGTRCTSLEALNQFFLELSQVSVHHHTPSNPTQKRQRAQDASRALDDLGI